MAGLDGFASAASEDGAAGGAEGFTTGRVATTDAVAAHLSISAAPWSSSVPSGGCCLGGCDSGSMALCCKRMQDK